MQAELILNNPRLPRRRKGGQPRIRSLRGTEPGAQDTYDPEAKAALLTRFYPNLFKATECQSELPAWVDLGKWFRQEDLERLPRTNGSLLKKAINLFKNNKSCADDMVVSEMLSVLDEDVLEILAEAFTKRNLNVGSQFVWRHVRENQRPSTHGILSPISCMVTRN